MNVYKVIKLCSVEHANDKFTIIKILIPGPWRLELYFTEYNYYSNCIPVCLLFVFLFTDPIRACV